MDVRCRNIEFIHINVSLRCAVSFSLIDWKLFYDRRTLRNASPSVTTVDSEVPIACFERNNRSPNYRHLRELRLNTSMATKLEGIIHHAIRTFKRTNKSMPEPLQNDLEPLKVMVDDVSLKDIKIPKFLLQKTEVHQFIDKKVKAKIEPVEYLRIHEDADVSIGVFILKHGAKLPIHDHPCMYGILKVLQGAIKVTSYSFVEVDTNIPLKSSSFFYQNPLKVIKHPESIVTDKDSCCTLTPTERSIHEVECINGPAAFLDILAPPYEEDSYSEPRGCHYFKEVEDKINTDGYVRLIQISNPQYWATPNE